VTARKRAKLLLRGRLVDAPLLCPLAVTQAAEIEARPVSQFLVDPTRLCTGLRALSEALGTGVIVTADGRPELLADPSQAAAAVEATRRLAATAADAAIAAALPGPAGGGDLIPLARAFLEAGANLLLLVEPRPLPAGSDAGWRAAATTVANVARFHQALPVVVLAAGAADATAGPRGAVVCVPDPTAGQGLALAVDPATWPAAAEGTPLVTTLGPVAGGFAAVREAVGRLAG
jgi:hypothetical protein